MSKIFSPIYVQNTEFILFKEEVLKDLNQFKSKSSSKLSLFQNDVTDKITNLESNINTLKQQFSSIDVINHQLKLNTEHILKLLNHNDLTSKKLSLYEKELNHLNKYFMDSIDEMRDAINKSIKYPGKIGIGSKFKSLHEFIDYVLDSLSRIINDKKKSDVNEIKKLKIRIDKISYKMKKKVEEFSGQITFSANNVIAVCDKKVNHLFDSLQNQINIQKEENKKKKKKIEEKIKSDNEGIKNIINNKNEIIDKIKDYEFKIKEELEKIKNKFEEMEKKKEKVDNIKTDDSNDKFKQEGLFLHNSNKQINNKGFSTDLVKTNKLKNINTIVNFNRRANSRLSQKEPNLYSMKGLKRFGLAINLNHHNSSETNILNKYIFENEKEKLNNAPKREIIRRLYLSSQLLNNQGLSSKSELSITIPKLKNIKDKIFKYYNDK